MMQNDAIKNPRVVVIQKLYGYHLNKDSELTFPKHKYKKFIKYVVNGTIERKELIEDLIDKELKNDINHYKTELIIKLMIMAAIYASQRISIITRYRIRPNSLKWLRRTPTRVE